jgi:hypothetical protein
MIAKPISIKLTGGKSGGCASKAVELTSGGLRHVTDSWLDEAIHPDHVAEVSRGRITPEDRRKARTFVSQRLQHAPGTGTEQEGSGE